MRSFSDGDGELWQVWKVIPSAGLFVERRKSERRTRTVQVGVDRRTGEDRRVADNRKGWLCFECGAERRRFYPVPSDWEDWPDSRLAWLCQRARKSTGGGC